MFLTGSFSLNFIAHASLGYQLTHTHTNKEEELLQPLECELGMLCWFRIWCRRNRFYICITAQCCCFAARLAFFTPRRKLLPYCSFSPLIFYCKGTSRHPLFNGITLFHHKLSLSLPLWESLWLLRPLQSFSLSNTSVNFWSIQLFTVYKNPSPEDKDKYFIICSSLKNLEEERTLGVVSWNDSDLHTHSFLKKQTKSSPNKLFTLLRK